MSTDTNTMRDRRAEAARWVPESEWYPRVRGNNGLYKYCGPVGRFMLAVSFDGYMTAEFRDTRDEAEDYAKYAGASNGGCCNGFLDLDTGQWTAIRVERTYTYAPVDADEIGMERDDDTEDEE